MVPFPVVPMSEAAQASTLAAFTISHPRTKITSNTSSKPNSMRTNDTPAGSSGLGRRKAHRSGICRISFTKVYSQNLSPTANFRDSALEPPEDLFRINQKSPTCSTNYTFTPLLQHLGLRIAVAFFANFFYYAFYRSRKRLYISLRLSLYPLPRFSTRDLVIDKKAINTIALPPLSYHNLTDSRAGIVSIVSLCTLLAFVLVR